MERERFQQLVARAVETLPEEFLERMENVDVVVEEVPSSFQLSRAGVRPGHTLLGLYEGVPLTRRSSHYGLVPPDKITIFQRTIEARNHTDDRIVRAIQEVVQHEIAHHFGISDARLDELKRNRESGR